MRTAYSMMFDHHGSRWAWLLLALLIVFGLIIYASNPTAGADVEVGKNECFPAHWCIPGTASGESTIKLAPASDAPPSAEQIKPGRQSLSSTTRPASSKT